MREGEAMADGLRRLALATALALASLPAGAAEFDDPEWPCIQRKVPELALFQMWPGPLPEDEPAADPERRAVAQSLVPRRVTLNEAEARVSDYASRLPDETRAGTLTALFAEVLAQINRERSEIIAGIGRYARRQAELSDSVEAMQQDLVALQSVPEAEKDWDRIEELEDRLVWEARVYRERAQSLTYVCETPVLLEQRAFALGRVIAGAI
jgi:hypothetical protein